MILVDSSVWIDLLRGSETTQVAKLRTLILCEPLLVGDLILCEVLRGAASDAAARGIESALREFTIVAVVNHNLAVRAAANYRYLRARGVAINKLPDLLIGTFCIERGHALLHSDRDYEPMERLLGLQTV